MKLKDTDLALWQEITKSVKPLPKRTSAHAHKEDAGQAEENSSDRTKASGKKASKNPKLLANPRNLGVKEKILTHTHPQLLHGDIQGIDRGTARRFKRGKLGVDAKLDLHGMTQNQAHQALDTFFSQAVAQGWRSVLVITGKGRSTYEAGILRRMVPQWLNEPKFRKHILAFSYAKQDQGGTGALNILLRKKQPRL